MPTLPLAIDTAVRTVAEHDTDHEALHDRYMSYQYLRRSGVLAETAPRNQTVLATGSVVVSGRQTLAAIWLPQGITVTNISFMSGTTAATTPTNQWFSLYSAAFAKLAVTVDDTTAAWGAETRKTLALSTPYVVSTGGLYYVGIMIAAAAVPTFYAVGSRSNWTAETPIIVRSDSTNSGLTTPATAPTTHAMNAAISALPFAEVT